MATFALVGCALPALTDAGPASLMCRLDASFARAWERAQAEADLTLILNPDYGLLHPDEEVRPGDPGLGDERWSVAPERWLDRVQRGLTSLRLLDDRHRWLILADGPWADAAAEALETLGQQVEHLTSSGGRTDHRS